MVKIAKLRGYDRSGNERNIDVQFEEAMDMVTRQTKAELHEVAAKAIILYADIKSCSVRNDVRRELRHIILTAENAKKLYNNSMTEILKKSCICRRPCFAPDGIAEPIRRFFMNLYHTDLTKTEKSFILENCLQVIR